MAKKFNVSMQKWTGAGPDAQFVSLTVAGDVSPQAGRRVLARVMQTVPHTTVQPGSQTQSQATPSC